MITFWRIAAYTFLALCGMYAWLATQEGWRHYIGLGLFFLATVRILILIFPRDAARRQAGQKEKADLSQPLSSHPPDKNQKS